MSEQRPRSHAGPPRSSEPTIPEPSFAERVRTLLSQVSVGTLSTHSAKHEGFPFGSVMPFALDADGRPILLISAMAMHTQNLLKNPKASLLVAQGSAGKDPLGAARVTLLGEALRLEGEAATAVRETYLSRHDNARYWVDFNDFFFFRMEVVDLYYVGGFGVMGWVEAGDFAAARPDPLAPSAAGILEHMNADHADALLLLARAFGGADTPEEAGLDEAGMTGIDRLGFRLRVRSGERWQSLRIPFPESIETPGAAREALVSMVREARGALAGGR